MAAPSIEGFCEGRFTPVRDALAANFRERGELGAAVSVTIEGRPVVELWGGWMDADRTRPWQRDTLVGVFSVGKAMATLCVLLLVDRGEVGLDSPVADYWPEFAAAGKGEITVRALLSHRAGLPAVRRLLSEDEIYDWDVVAAALAAEEPWWEPGALHGYHVNTFGFLTGEVVRRVSGAGIGEFFRREIAQPLGADFHFGLAPEDDSRTADYEFGGAAEEPPGAGAAERLPLEADAARRFMLGRVYLNPPQLSGIGTVNTRAWRAAEIPSANAHATAWGVTRIYGALADVLSEPTLAEAITPRSDGIDFVLGRPSRFGLGFQLTQPERPLGPNPRAFGHFGAGGSLGFADPDARVEFAYVMNRAGPRWQNPRNRALIDALYACL
jgi:CubicO group peptidase (beta-lactamase class C family)